MDVFQKLCWAIKNGTGGISSGIFPKDISMTSYQIDTGANNLNKSKQSDRDSSDTEEAKLNVWPRRVRSNRNRLCQFLFIQ